MNAQTLVAFPYRVIVLSIACCALPLSEQPINPFYAGSYSRSSGSELKLIDQASASKRAAGEMSYVKQTINTLVYDLNIVSISPVFMFDVAHIGPADSGLGTRYGIGGGLRVTLVNSGDFTAGYLANPKRNAGEAAGAFFLSLRFKDLF